jgi:hypothetical protein
MEMDTKMTLGNCSKDENNLIIQPDMGSGFNYVAFSVTVDGDRMPLSEKELDPDDGGETYFHINKVQARVLIAYLQSLVDDM